MTMTRGPYTYPHYGYAYPCVAQAAPAVFQLQYQNQALT
jgi:hypothetical protein